MNSIVHVLLGQGDYHPMTNTFHGGEQVPIQGIVILKLETTIIRKPENFPSSEIFLRVQPMDNKDERYIWEKRENAFYDIRRENRG